MCVGSTTRDAFQHDCTTEASRPRYEAVLPTLATNFGAVMASTAVANA